MVLSRRNLLRLVHIKQQIKIWCQHVDHFSMSPQKVSNLHPDCCYGDFEEGQFIWECCCRNRAASLVHPKWQFNIYRPAGEEVEDWQASCLHPSAQRTIWSVAEFCYLVDPFHTLHIWEMDLQNQKTELIIFVLFATWLTKQYTSAWELVSCSLKTWQHRCSFFSI